MSTSAIWGSPRLPAGSVAQPESLVNEWNERNEALASKFAVAFAEAPIGEEAEGTIYIVAGSPDPADVFADHPNKIAKLGPGGWLFMPDKTSAGADIAMGPQHAGTRFYIQSSSPPGFWLWDGTVWAED